VNLHRTPVGGRNFECMSEDPLLTAVTAVEYVKGVQSYGVASCIKHFVGNDTEFERMTIDSRRSTSGLCGRSICFPSRGRCSTQACSRS